MPNGVFNGDGDPRLEREAKFLRICNGDELEPLRSGVFNFLTPGPGDTFSSLIFFEDIFESKSCNTRQKFKSE